MLRHDIESAWTCGDSLYQRLYDRQAPTINKFRLLGIAIDRLQSPNTYVSDPDVILGVRVNEHGRPLSYYIAEPSHIGPYRQMMGNYAELQRSQAIHVFDQIEPGQLRGIPWLASSLLDISNSKAFATETIELARSAKILGVVLEADSDGVESPVMPTNKTVPIPRRGMTYVKQGWRAKQISGQNPGTGYIEFQHENYRSIGRPVGMPLLTILLDARYHNYSSARYDGQVYRRHLNAIQSRLTRQKCNPCANQVLLDLERAGQIRRRPQRVSLVWGWSNPPEIDEEKTARANDIKLRQGSISLSEVCSASNRSLEEVIQQRVRDDELLVSSGLPTVMESLAKVPAAQPNQNAQDSKPGGAKRDSEMHLVRMEL